MPVDFGLANTDRSPYEGLERGLNNGANMGFQFQRQKMLQQKMMMEQEEAARQAEQMKQEEKKINMQALTVAGAHLKELKSSPTVYADYFKKVYAPLTTKALGEDFELDTNALDFDNENDRKASDEFLNLTQSVAAGKLDYEVAANGLMALSAKYQGNDALGEKAKSTAAEYYKMAKTGTLDDKAAIAEEAERRKTQAKLAKELPKAKASLASTLREYDNMIKEAEAIKNDPGLELATGASSFMGRLPGKMSLGAKTPRARLETLKAKTLLNVLSSLKELSATGASGFGQLSNIEGETLRNSISTLDPDLDTPDFKASIDRFVNEMRTRKGVLQGTFEDTYGESLGGGGGGGETPEQRKARLIKELSEAN